MTDLIHRSAANILAISLMVFTGASSAQDEKAAPQPPMRAELSHAKSKESSLIDQDKKSNADRETLIAKEKKK